MNWLLKGGSKTLAGSIKKLSSNDVQEIQQTLDDLKEFSTQQENHEASFQPPKKKCFLFS